MSPHYSCQDDFNHTMPISRNIVQTHGTRPMYRKMIPFKICNLTSLLDLRSQIVQRYACNMNYHFYCEKEQTTPDTVMVELFSKKYERIHSAHRLINAYMNPSNLLPLESLSSELKHLISLNDNYISSRNSVKICTSNDKKLMCIFGLEDDLENVIDYLRSISNDPSINQLEIMRFCDSIKEYLSKFWTFAANDMSNFEEIKSICKSKLEELAKLRDEYTPENKSESNRDLLCRLQDVEINEDAFDVIDKLKTICQKKRESTQGKQLKMMLNGKPKRPIIIDTLNVCYDDQAPNSANLIRLASLVLWLLQAGLVNIKISYPQWIHSSDDRGVLSLMKELDALVVSPYDNNKKAFDDDKFILLLATELEGCIISNDHFKQYVNIDNGIYNNVIRNRIIKYTFLDDSTFIILDDNNNELSSIAKKIICDD